MSRKSEILSKVETVPALPSAALKVTALAQDPDVAPSKLARIIQYDPGLAANVLRLANSAFFAGPRSIASVKDAVLRLGATQVSRLVVAAVAGPLMRREVKGYILSAGALWEHAVATAVGAEQAAKVLRITAPDYTFTAALLHDVGKIVLGNFIEVDAAPLMKLVKEEALSFEEAEERILGINHAEVGALLLEHWRLPPEVVEAVRRHHRPQECAGGDSALVDLVHLADILSMMSGIGLGADGLGYRPSADTIERLKPGIEAIEAITCRMFDKLEEVRVLFGAETRRVG